MSEKQHYGTVKFWSGGYGFVKDDNSQVDYFCHYSQIREMEGYKILEAGDHVQFEVGPGKDERVQALNVILLQEGD